MILKFVVFSIALVFYSGCDFTSPETKSDPVIQDDFNYYSSPFIIEINPLDSDVVFDSPNWGRFTTSYYGNEVFDSTWWGNEILPEALIKEQIYARENPVLLAIFGINSPDDIVIDTLKFVKEKKGSEIFLQGFVRGGASPIQITLNGSPVDFDHFWWATTYTLPVKGVNELIVVATDSLGNQAKDTLVLFYE